MSNALTMAESKELATRDQKIYVIAPDRKSVDDFAYFIRVSTKTLTWLLGPEGLKGTKGALVVILPNWWRRDYTGMEQALVDTEAEIYTVYYGRKPVYKNQQPILPRH